MSSIINFFKDKNITVLGLGLLGRGVGDILFLAPLVSSIMVTDKKTEVELMSSLEYLKNKLSETDFNKIKFVLGEHRKEDFINRDFIMKAAGVPLDSEYISISKDNNIPVYMSAALVVDLVYRYIPDVKVIGVTGTRGKSTATMMIYHMLEVSENIKYKSAERDSFVYKKRKVHLGGNVRGVANLPLLNEIKSGDYLVLELDSWQLQGFGDLEISPNVSVFTSFLDDHLNYYKGDRVAYFNDKANIYRWQKESDILISSQQASESILYYEDKNNFKENISFEKIKNKIIIPSISVQSMNIIGEHNKVIAGLVHEVGIKLGLDYDDIVSSIRDFKAVEGRLQYMGEIQTSPMTMQTQASPLAPLLQRGGPLREYNSVIVYNDNNATTPDATVVGVEAVNDKYKKPCILICGGADKGLDLLEMSKIIQDKSKVKQVILLSGTGSEKLKSSIETLNKSNDIILEFETLKECVDKAIEIATGGDVILYSPGFASFSPYFKNEYEKNDEFVRCIKSLI